MTADIEATLAPLRELAKLREAATPGPWYRHADSIAIWSDDERNTLIAEVSGAYSNPEADADAAFIAAAGSVDFAAIFARIDELLPLVAALEELRETLETIANATSDAPDAIGLRMRTVLHALLRDAPPKPTASDVGDLSVFTEEWRAVNGGIAERDR